MRCGRAFRQWALAFTCALSAIVLSAAPEDRKAHAQGPGAPCNPMPCTNVDPAENARQWRERNQPSAICPQVAGITDPATLDLGMREAYNQLIAKTNAAGGNTAASDVVEAAQLYRCYVAKLEALRASESRR
jgi:hypothetical protein